MSFERSDAGKISVSDLFFIDETFACSNSMRSQMMITNQQLKALQEHVIFRSLIVSEGFRHFVCAISTLMHTS